MQRNGHPWSKLGTLAWILSTVSTSGMPSSTITSQHRTPDPAKPDRDPLVKCLHRRSTWSWSTQVPCLSSTFTSILRGKNHKMWPHQNSQVDHAIGLHQVLSVEPGPRAPRDPTSTVLDTPAGRAATSASVRAARFIDSGIAACRPLETRHFQSPNSSSPHPLPLDSAPITGKLAEARLCSQGMAACLLPAIDSAAVGLFATKNTTLLSDPRPSLRRTDDLAGGRHVRTCEGGSCSSAPLAAPSVRPVHQPRAARPSPHISKSQFPEMLVQPHGPPPGLHVWRDRQCFRHAARPMPYAPDGECDRCSLAPANHGAPPSTLLAAAAA